MSSFNQFLRNFAAPRSLSQSRIVLAFTIAVVTDGLQFALGPFGWVLVDQGLDALAMVLISRVIGFHMLLLPTFIIEFIPGPDMLPTWIGCTAAVVMLRKRAQPAPPIDVSAEVTPVATPGENVTSMPVPPKILPPQAQTRSENV